MTPSIPETIGRYEIAKVLGQGGMGVVYLGRDPGMERQVAVKTVKAGADDSSKSRLRIEGKAGKLDHENIVTVFETGQWNGDLPYIAMEFIVGDPLDKIALSERQLSMIEKLDCIRQVCEGLDYAHLNGVLHRDIKPANIIRRFDGRIKIVDFGIAKVATDMTVTALTAPLQVIGTLAYMAPERLRGVARLDGRVDIFATGVLLYFLLTGEEPFTGEMQTIMHKLMNEPHPPLSKRLLEYPPFLDQILDRALAKDPDDRYSTAQEFAADLAAVIDELNRGRIAGMLEDCRRLIAENQYQAATDKAGQVLKIDPQNQTGRDVQREARRRLADRANEERLNNLVAEAVQAVGERRYEPAIQALEEVVRKRPGDENVLSYLDTVREKWRVHVLKERLCKDAANAENSQDLTGAIKYWAEAAKVDPDDIQVLENVARLEKTLREQEARTRAERHITSAKQKLTAKRYTEAIELLEELRKARISHPELDPLLSEALSAQRQQDIERRREHYLNQAKIRRAAADFTAALAELDTGLRELPSDTMLLRVKREIEREVEQSELSLWIEQTVDRVLSQALVSIDEALGTVGLAMKRLPGEERFEALEADLLRRRREASDQQRRFTCLRDAGEALQTGDAAKSIRILEQYLLENRSTAELDGLMQDARRALEEQSLRLTVAEFSDKARTLLDQGHFERAIALLQPVIEQTGNRGLVKLLERAEQAKADAEEKIKLLAVRIAELRRQGKLTDSIALLEGQPSGVIERPLVQDLLAKLREERKRNEDRLREEAARREAQMREEAARRDALAAATAKTRTLIERGDWQSAREPLENAVRVYGELDMLTQALAAFDRERADTANERVGRAVESAKASFVADDRDTARKALAGSADLVAFASPALAEEWKRLEKIPKAKEKIKPPPSAIDLAEPEERVQAKSKVLPLAAAAVVLLAAGGGFLFWHASAKPANPPVVGQAVQPTPGPAENRTVAPQPDAPRAEATGGSGPASIAAPLVNAGPGGKPPVTKVAPAPERPPSKPGEMPSTEKKLAAEPKVVDFGSQSSSIEAGSGTVIRWNVANVQSVDIANVGTGLARQGNKTVYPEKDTDYVLSAGGIVLNQVTVAVKPKPKPQEPVIVAKKVDPVVETHASDHPQPVQSSSSPDPAALRRALSSFQGIFARASAGKKECKSALGSLSQYGSGKPASDLQTWCDGSTTIQGTLANCSGTPSGTEKDSTWACSEVITVTPQGSASFPTTYHGEAHFAKSGDAPWQLTRWDLQH